jgi:hypothetical protein
MYASDHRPLYVNFNIATLCGHPEIGTEKAALRDLQLENTRLIDAYKSALCKKFEYHNVEFKFSQLFATASDMWNNNNEFQFNQVDLYITRAMQSAVNKCRFSQYRKHPCSEKFKQANYHII